MYREIVLYISTNQLLMYYMENGDSWLKFVRRCAALNVLMRLISAGVYLDSAGEEELSLAVAGSRCLPTSGDFPGQI